jgi:polyphosphate kinase
MASTDPSGANSPQVTEPPTDLENRDLFLNRELRWRQFNLQVLEEAEDVRHPLFERVKFLALFATNLDEFFMIRISGLRRQAAGGAGETPPHAMTPSKQMLAICREVTIHLEWHRTCWQQDLLPKLREHNKGVASHLMTWIARLASSQKK